MRRRRDSLQQLNNSRTQIETAVNWGIRYAVYWALYCTGNEFDNKNGTWENSDFKGCWLIRPDGTYSYVWDYLFHTLHTRDTDGFATVLVDTLDDYSKMHLGGPFTPRWKFATDTSYNKNFDGDLSRLTRTANTKESIVYAVNSFREFTVKVYSAGSNPPGVKIYRSPNGTQWYQVINFQSYPAEPTANGWSRHVYRNMTPFLAGTANFLKIEFADDPQITSPQLASVIITN
jgi:hypothetical protein